MAIRAYMICHTHWDREWYLTKNQFKTKMVRMVDSVLDSVESDPSLSFMLNGQTIVLEDYLAIRPENRERLHAAISSGRLCAGPWYILPDEILVSGESHVRNYLIGQKVAAQFGGKMNLAYLPDSFGHPAQMPQILSGLTMDTSLFWRGVPGEIADSEFIWQSPCESSSVLAINLPRGYGNSARLESDLSVTIPRLKAMMEQLSSCTRGDLVLLMNGSDHILNQPEIGHIVFEFNRACAPDYEIQISTLEEFVAALKPTLKDLGRYQGELRSGDRSMLLSGTMSTRTYLKQWNTRVQSGMERYLEPAVVTQMLSGQRPDFAGYQDYLWRKILENQPHDSICGCSVDAVHAEMMTRFHRVDELETTLYNDTMQSLGLQQTKTHAAGVQMLHFESTQDSLPCCIEVEVDFDPMLVQQVNFAHSTIDEYEAQIDHPPLPEGVRVTDSFGRAIPCRLLHAEKAYFNHLQDFTAPEIYKVNRCRVALQLPAFPYGVSVLTFERGSAQLPAPHIRASFIENEYYRVSPDGEGGFCVTCKESGKTYRGVARLIDKGDAGDEYSYSWPRKDTVCTLAGVPLEISAEKEPDVWQKLHLKAQFPLPCSLCNDRQARSAHTKRCPVRVTATLFAGRADVDFTVEFENNVQDHILQLEFPAGVKAETSSASSAFAVTQRPIDFTVPDTWMERPLPSYPTHGLIDVSSEKGGVSVVCEGLNEFEALQEKDESLVRVTLLRCVGWLSRADLLTRKGNGGWCYETPDAQCPGAHTFHCAALYHAGSFREAGTLQMADRILHPPVLTAIFSAAGKLLPQNPLACLSQLPPELRLSACKPAEDGRGVVLRLFSVAQVPVTLHLPLPQAVEAVFSCTLAETGCILLACDNGTLDASFAPGEIRTFYWKLRA